MLPKSCKQKNQEFYEHYKAGTLDIHAYIRFATAAVIQPRRYQNR